MKIICSGQEKNIRNVRVRAMNFGQHWRSEGILRQGYELWLDWSVFEKYYQNRWKRFLEDAKNMESDDEIDIEIQRLNFPSLLEIRSNPLNYNVLIGFLFEVDGHDLLLDHFGDAGGGAELLVLNSIHNVEVTTDYIRLRGEFRNNLNVSAFQDY